MGISKKIYFISIIALFCAIDLSLSQDTEIEENSTGLYQVEGKVYPPELSNDENYKNWIQDTEIVINSGEF
jgi:hypothetical protein